ncbi:hypothetical protein [Bordetella bronchiseptica]|uniref:hypothetical protein n=1 Tax=Bordetella bronchiseptica TaxID=518 RepID=UPI003EDBD207
MTGTPRAPMVSGLFRIGALLAAGLLCGGAWAQDAEADPYGDPIVAPRAAPPQWKPLKIGPPGHRYAFPLYSSKNLERDDLRGIRRLVIVLHGVKRNAASILGTVTALFAANPERAEDTLVIAPKFASAIDAGFAAMPAWRRASWEDGELSMQARGRPAPVSSLQVLDDLLRELSDSSRLPALRTIVLAGHSGGAQLVQRYAVLNSLDETLRREGLTLQYVVANPSSYLYLSPERPRADGKGHAPYERGICPTYNQYKYGLDHLPAYARGLDPASLPARYAQRHVTYLLGSADNNPEHQLLDKSCGAEAQGATRLARGLGYWRYEAGVLAPRLPRSVAWHHDAQEVVDAGHDAAQMFSSSCGARALLGDRSAPLPDGPACLPARR